MGNLAGKFKFLCPAKEKCRDGDQSHLEGHSWSRPGQCERRTCLRGGKILVERCPVVQKQQGCDLVISNEEEQEEFPECCQKLSCWEMIDSTPEPPSDP